MTDEIDEAGKAELLHSYQAAVIEFNLATVPLVVAMAAELRPSVGEVTREEKARATVVAARQKVWAVYCQD